MQAKQVLFQSPVGAASEPLPFVWGVGIENTFVPQTRRGHRSLDEYALMGHYHHWRADIDRIASLGVRAVRYGIPWYQVNPRSGQFDWSWLDQVVPHLVQSGLTPIIDLVHFGTPLWLQGEFLAPDYPARVAEYAGAVAERYQGLVSHFTPLNEPAVTAVRSGLTGTWPPYRRGWRGYVAVLLAVARGIIATAVAIRAVQPEAAFVHAEDVGLELAATPDLAPWAETQQARRWLPLDLVCGRVGVDHPLRPWLIRGGATPEELDVLAEQAIPWDAVGINFYPWSNRVWRQGRMGTPRPGRDRSDPAAALETLLAEAFRRCQCPVVVSETSAPGSMRRRLAWMHAVATGVTQARSVGIPVQGLIWFPVFTMVDWRYRRSRRPVEQHYLHLGLWDVSSLDSSNLDRTATPLVAAFRDLIASSRGDHAE